MNFFRVLNIHNDKVETSSRFEFLYGTKLMSTTEQVITLSENHIASLIERGRSLGRDDHSSFIFTLILRKKITGYNGYKTDIYFLSYNKELLMHFSNLMGSGNTEYLSGEELTEVLFRAQTLDYNILLRNNKPVYKNIVFKKNNDVENPPIYILYESMVKDKIDIENKLCFIGYNIENVNATFNLQNILREEWQGALWLTWDFNDLNLYISSRISAPKGQRTQYKKIKELYNTGRLKLAGFQAIFITDKKLYKGLDESEIEGKAIYLLEQIGLRGTRKRKDEVSFIAKTPLMIRDLDYVFLVTHNYGKGLFTKGIEKLVIPEKVDIYGINKFKDYVSLSFFDENTAPHRLIIAPTGSGKSFKIQKELVIRLNVDIKKLMEGEQVQYDGSKFVRYFEIGHSSAKLVNLLKLRGLDVAQIPASINEFKYNLCEVYLEDTDVDDLSFSAYLASLILVLLGDENGLTAAEQGYYKKFLEKAVKEKNKYCSWMKRMIADLKKDYPEDYEKLMELGYDEYMTIEKININDHPRFARFHMPVIDDLVRLCNEERNKSGLTESDKESLNSLYSKLNTLAKISLFNGFSKVSIKNSPFLYIELNEIKAHPLFPAIVGTYLRKVYDEDRKVGRSVEKIYIIEEAHNYLGRAGNEKASLIFLNLFDIMAREARKYRIQVNFISQVITDIPDTIYQNIPIKEFLLPGRGADPSTREDTIKAICTKMGETVRPDLELLPPYTSIVFYGNGRFTLKAEVTADELPIFDTKDASTEKITTKDGYIITKDGIKIATNR